MNVTDRVRLEAYLLRYDFWLDVTGVPGRMRRGLVRELRANLVAAGGDVGVSAALAGTGDPRTLADEAADSAIDRRRPAWLNGANWAATVLLGYLLLVAFAALSFLDGVRASGVEHEVRGSLLLAPGLDAVAQARDGSIAIGVEGLPWFALGLAVVAFVLGSRCWRLRRPARPAHTGRSPS